MRLIQNQRVLKQLDIMFEKGTYRITKINQSSAGTDYYVIDAPTACSDVLAVPCHYRPKWTKYLKGGK